MSSPFPYNLKKLIKTKPSAKVRPWTFEEHSIVVSLHICWMHVKAWEWGTDRDWALLEPLFDHNGEYLGTLG